ncbi:MAG TPA: outer membrane protein assembly factor BamD [Desulfobacterales bacterium]|nr:outer membrane protein assembly factor BamD [Desulfobacterales bacterium]HIP39438.1 outer membrane protein assembly factor BamD [Desulfocapsa sulfexigens]
MVPRSNKNRKRSILLKSSLKLVLLSTLLISLGSCATIESWFGKDDDATPVRLSAQTLAGKGMDEYSVGNYYKARKYFDEILDYYPFSQEATLAQLKGADSNYYMENYQEALMLYHEFEERHPTNEAIPYVMYHIAMSNYQQIDRIDRDTSGAEGAIKEFSKLLRAFPNSPYTNEARARIRAANEFLVNHEYFVVEFYLRTEKYTEAQSRLQYLINTYPDASITPKAKKLLARLEAGEPPGFDLSSWFKDNILPDWTKFDSDKDTLKK